MALSQQGTGRPTFNHVKVICRSNLVNRGSYERDKGEDFIKKTKLQEILTELHLECHIGLLPTLCLEWIH